MVTTQHEIDEPKFLAKKGPNGTYSQVCKSRADQSFNNTIPNMWFSASLTETLSPIILASAVIKAVSNSKSTLFDGPKTGCVSPFGKVCPIGLFTGTPDGTMVELLPWYPTGRCNQLGNKAFAGSRNIIPTLVACSLEEEKSV